MAEFVNCKMNLLLTYGKSITNMVKLVAYAFPTQRSYSSLNPDAAVYVSSTHTDSHNQQHDEIKPPPPPPHRPSTPEKGKQPHDNSHTNNDPHNQHRQHNSTQPLQP
jgi:hypothetical protein